MTTTCSQPRGSSAPPARSSPPPWSVGGFFTYFGGVYELRLTRPPQSIGRSCRDAAEFALIGDDPLLIAARFGDSVDWLAADYRGTLDHARGTELPPLDGPAEHRALMSVMVPGPEARWLSLGNFTLSLDFSRALNASIRERAIRPFHPARQARALDGMATHAPSLVALITQAGLRSGGNP